MFSGKFVLVQFLAIFGFQAISAEAELCGLAKADPDKTCISVRLPWQEDPIYFCQDAEKITYRKTQTCHGCHEHQHKGQLLISTPWDCCPLVSKPDFCANQQCGAKPFNRTCVDVPQEGDSVMCCSDPFCEDGLKSKDECHKIALEPKCLEPPKDKTKCIGFVDPFGCCTKFQCAEDVKPGLCPKEKEAIKFSTNWNDTDADTDETETTMTKLYSNSKDYAARNKHLSSIRYGPLNDQMFIRCVGDFNCPGKMKCCSHDVSVYSDGTVLTKNENPTVGHCSQPVKE